MGLWQERYQGIEGLWLRWYDQGGNWIAIAEEQVEQERERAEQQRQRADRLAARIRELGQNPEEI